MNENAVQVVEELQRSIEAIGEKVGFDEWGRSQALLPSSRAIVLKCLNKQISEWNLHNEI